MKVQELLGCYVKMAGEVRSRGGHRTLKHPEKAGLVIVAIHGSGDVPTGTLKAIMKQAGLEVKK